MYSFNTRKYVTYLIITFFFRITLDMKAKAATSSEDFLERDDSEVDMNLLRSFVASNVKSHVM